MKGYLVPDAPAAPPIAPVLLTEPQAAAALCLCARSLANARRRGEVAFVKIGTSIRYRPADLKLFARERRQREGVPA